MYQPSECLCSTICSTFCRAKAPLRTIDFCRKHGIVVEAYSPLGGGSASNAARNSGGEVDGTRWLLQHPIVKGISKETGKTEAQVLLRWALQQDFMVIPRSSKPFRVKENFEVFDFQLSEKQMASLTDIGKEGQKFCWDPKGVS